MTHDLPSAQIIIVAYGHADRLGATLAAVSHLDYPRESLAVVVVENGDGSSAAVARSYAGVRVLEPGRNLGFAGGCNLAAAACDSRIIVLLNPDLEPEPGFLRALVAPLRESSVGVVGAKLLYPDRRAIQHAGGWLKGPLLLAQHTGYGEAADDRHESSRDVEFVTGAALALRRDTWQRLSGLDERFWPAYYEDVDLCLRARDLGFVVRYEPRAVAIHHESTGVGKGSVTYHALYHRNRLRLLWKRHDDAWLAQTWLPAELDHLRAVADDRELDGLFAAYHCWQQTFLLGAEPPNPQLPTPSSRPESELAWTLSQVGRKREVAPQPFRSRWPLVARIRSWINRLVTEDYIRPLIQQQNDFNASVAELAAALARQRRAADAAILCQGVLLAKLLQGSKTSEERQEDTETRKADG